MSTVSQIIKGISKAAVRHKKRIDKHEVRVLNALKWYVNKTGMDEVSASVKLKYKNKNCMVVGYGLNYPLCYFSLRPMKQSDDIGNGAGCEIKIDF